jgi:hypothetical protein
VPALASAANPGSVPNPIAMMLPKGLSYFTAKELGGYAASASTPAGDFFAPWPKTQRNFTIIHRDR